MKRFLTILYFAIFGLSIGFAQSGKIIDDLYVTPNDAQMVQAVKSGEKGKVKKSEIPQSAVYRNGAREIVFIDRNGNRVNAVSDTVYVLDEGAIDDSAVVDDSDKEDGYYLNGFKGTKSDFEYAERIRRFHNPGYTITIADPGYNDIYFLDNNYWNVHTDGMYATITPTWNNPYWWNYQYSSFSYNSWAWRYNWGYPYYSNWGWGGWYNPWYAGYYGWGYPYYGSYYGWGGYPYYGNYCYGGGYPYYGGGYYSDYNSAFDNANRRGNSLGRYNNSGLRSDASRRSTVNGSGAYTRVSTNPSLERNGRSGANTTAPVRDGRSVVSGVDTRTRTGAVRSAYDWNNTRSTRNYSTGTTYDAGRSSSGVINRSNPSTSRSSSMSSGADRTYDRSSGSTPSRSSSSTYNTSPSRSYDSSPSRSSSSYGGSSRSSSSSGGGSYGGGGSSSSGRSSSGSGTRR